MLVLKELEKRESAHPNAAVLLQNINLTLEPSTITGLIVRSAASREALLHCLNYLEPPTSGEVIFNHQAISDLTKKDFKRLRQKICIIYPDHPLLYSQTVEQNVAFPLSLTNFSIHRKTQTIQDILSFTGLSDKANYLASTLSSEDRCRVALARALVMDPEIIACNEITSNLDNKATRRILDLLEHIHKNYSVSLLLLTHELEAIKYLCDHVGIIAEGQLVEYQKPVDLILSPKSPQAHDLIKTMTRLEMPNALKRDILNQPEKNTDGELLTYPLLRLAFLTERSEQHILPELIQTFNLDMNIVQAYQDEIQGQSINIMLLEISPNDINAETAFDLQMILDYLTQKNLSVEVIGYVRNTA
jgi:D-methionine transport system ATP-binding protein